jgi:phospholipid transport system substrate-binding protein
MMKLNEFKIPRRGFLTAMLSTVVVGPAYALDNATATKLVDQVVFEINQAINSRASEAKLIKAFEGIFAKYADVNIISRSALGPRARTASALELNKFSFAFRSYIARKYGRRFKEFVGSAIIVKNTTNRGKFFEVGAMVQIPGSAPFEVAFRVSDRSGKQLFFDIIIEGISLLSSERVEIGALLDARNGHIGRLTQDLSGSS